MSLNLKLIKVSGATMNSKYSKKINQHNLDMDFLSYDLSQWLGDSYVIVKKMRKELARDKIKYSKK